MHAKPSPKPLQECLTVVWILLAVWTTCRLEDPDDLTELQNLPSDDAVSAVSCGKVFEGYIEDRHFGG